MKLMLRSITILHEISSRDQAGDIRFVYLVLRIFYGLQNGDEEKSNTLKK